MSRTALAGILAALLVSGAHAETLLPNPSFEQAQGNVPLGWQAEGRGTWERGAHSGKRCVGIVAAPGQESAYWRCPADMLKPGGIYRFSFWVKGVGASGGCVVSGPSFANRDFGQSPDWQMSSFVFVAPPNLAGAYVRVGMWAMQGKLLVDDVWLEEVVPVPASYRGLGLSEGEEIAGDEYRFAPDSAYEGSNYTPQLVRYTCGFNSNRWPFGPGAELVYRQGLPGVKMTSGQVTVNLGYHTSGECVIEAGADGQTWTEVGAVGKLGSASFDLPAALLPAEQVYIRLRSTGAAEARAEAAPGAFQVTGYTFAAKLDRDLGQARGATRFLRVQDSSPDLTVRVVSLGALRPGADNQITLRLRNNTGRTVKLEARASTLVSWLSGNFQAPEKVTLLPNTEAEVGLPYRLRNDLAGPRRQPLGMTVREAGVRQSLFTAYTEIGLSVLDAEGYGYLIQGQTAASPAVWWCESTYKVSRDRPVPDAKWAGVKLAAAGNEFEAAQVVLRSAKGLRGLMATVQGPAGLRGVRWTVDRVAYHYVTKPSDAVGCIGWWPDALPPLREPVDVAADQNQPLWITAYVPAGARPGTFRARLDLKAEGWQASVPIELRVYGFSLSKEPHLESGFGLSTGPIARYHNLTDPADVRRVWDLYMQNFRDHRLSTYDFAPFDPFRIKLSGGADAWQGGEFVTENSASGKQCLKIVDDSASQAISANYNGAVPIEKGATYRFSWKRRTAEAGQPYQVTLGQLRADGSWQPGHNLDRQYIGDGTWKAEELLVTPDLLTTETTQLSLTLRPTPWTEAGENTGTAWFDDLHLGKADGGPNLLRDPGFEADAGDITVAGDFAAWDEQARKYLDEYHFTNVSLPMMGLAGMSFDRTGTGRLGPYKQGSEGYERLYREAAMTVQNHLEQNGWLRKGYVYWYDEPEPKDYPYVKEGMQLIKRGAPKVRRMLTEEPVKDLFGEVDVWCPVESALAPVATAARQKQGETIWWYVCTGPKEPWPGLFIDHDALDLRAWLWLTVKYNVQGVLIWTTNWWTSGAAFPQEPQNPWTDPMGYVDGYGFQAGQVAFWGNGDGRMLYPPNQDVNGDRKPYLEGPVSSLRWEILRDGCEDYEYFYELRQAIAKAKSARKPAKLITEAQKLAVVPVTVVKDGTSWNHDPQALLRHRARVAEMIEKLR